MESMARDMRHPYIPSTTVLGDIGMAQVPRHRFHTFEKLLFHFPFQQHLPLSLPPSSHCRYARLPEVWLNEIAIAFIFAILHLLLLVVVVVAVVDVVFSFDRRNSKTVRGIRLKLFTMIEYLNPACNVMSCN